MICHAWNAASTSNSFPKVPTHANCIWPCHIATLIWRNPHTQVLRQEFGPPKSASWWLEFTTQLDPRTNCASFAFRCWAIKGQAEETWWGPVAMPTLISMFKSPWNLCSLGPPVCIHWRSQTESNGKYTPSEQPEEWHHSRFMWITDGFHCISQHFTERVPVWSQPFWSLPPAVRKLSKRLGQENRARQLWVKQ